MTIDLLNMDDIPREIFCYIASDEGEDEDDECNQSSSSNNLRSLSPEKEEHVPWRGWAAGSSRPRVSNDQPLQQGLSFNENNSGNPPDTSNQEGGVKPSFLRSVSQKCFPRRQAKPTISTREDNLDKIRPELDDTKRTALTLDRSLDDAVAQIDERLNSLDSMIQEFLQEIEREDVDEEEKKQIRARYAKRILM